MFLDFPDSCFFREISADFSYAQISAQISAVISEGINVSFHKMALCFILLIFLPRFWSIVIRGRQFAHLKMVTELVEVEVVDTAAEMANQDEEEEGEEERGQQKRETMMEGPEVGEAEREDNGGKNFDVGGLGE